MKAMKWTPRPYMLKAVKFLLQHGAAALLLDPGLGKTSITLRAFLALRKEGTASRMLVIAPLRVCYLVWRQEAEKWLDFNGLRFELLHGPDKDAALKRDADVYLMNPEGLAWLASNGRLKQLGADILVVDESTRFKHTKTARFKMLKPMLKSFRRRWILTGTPVPNGLLDLFGQVYLLDLGNALGQYITHFRCTYFSPTGYGGFDWVLQEGAEERIYEKLRPLALRLSAADHLDLPELLFNNIIVELPPRARMIYDDMEQELLALLESGEVVTAVSAAVASMKCRQIANGGLYHPKNLNDLRRGKAWEQIHDAKTEAVEDLVEELSGKPLLVAYEFEHDLARLLKAFGKDVPNLSGVNLKKAAVMEAAWNRGEIPIMLGQPASIAHGLNLQGAGSDVVFYSMPWDYENYDQFIKRKHRQGAKSKRIRVHHILAKNTIDFAVLGALQHKNKVQNKLLDALKSYAKQRK